MADLDPKLLEKLEKMGIILDTANASLDANNKGIRSATANAILEEQARRKLIDNLKTSLNLSKQEAQQLADKIKQEEELADQREDELKKEESRSKKRDDFIKRLSEEVTKFATSSVSASQSIYNSNKSFTAVLPTLQLVSDTVSTVIEATGKMLSGVGVSITGFGFNTGKASEAIAGFVDAGSKLAFAQAKIQIENAQKFVDTYSALSKVGLSFGGAVEEMRQSAKIGRAHV